MGERTSIATTGAAVLGAVVLVALGVARGSGDDRPSEPTPLVVESANLADLPGREGAIARAPHPQAVALLGGLKVGETIGGWRIHQFGEFFEGALLVRVTKGEVRAVIEIRAIGGDARPMEKTAHYALFVILAEPDGRAVAAAGVGDVLVPLKQRIVANEKQLGKLPQLTTAVVEPRPAPAPSGS